MFMKERLIIPEKLKMKYMTKTHIYSIIDSIKFFETLKSELKIKLINKLNIEKYSSKEIIISQNSPINKIFIVSKGSFILLFNHVKISTDDLNIDFYVNYQNLSNKHFNNLRKHELNGKFFFKFTDKLIIYSLKEFIGDIEFSLNKNKSFFTVVCNENNSELLSINFNDFKEIVGKKIVFEIKNFAMEKIRNFNKRIKEIKNNHKKCFINEENNIKNIIIKQFHIENSFEKKSFDKNFSFRNNKKLKNSISAENIFNNNKINKFLFDNKIKTERKNNKNNFNQSFKNFSLTKNSIEKSRNNNNNNNDNFYIKSYNSIDKPKNIFRTNSQIINSSEKQTKIKLKLKNNNVFIKHNNKNNKIRLNFFNKNFTKNFNNNLSKEINFDTIDNNNINKYFNKNIFFKKNLINNFLYDKYKLLRNNSTSKIINNKKII